MSTSTDSVETVDCETWEKFREAILLPNRATWRTIYRGVRSSKFELASKWERWLLRTANPAWGPAGRIEWWDRSVPGLLAVRDGFVARFHRQLLTLGDPGTRALAAGERPSSDVMLALGRHHGLVSPLLDWTHSPYVAAYFAVMDHLDCPEVNPKGLEHAAFPLDRGACGLSPGSGRISVWELGIPDDLFANPQEFRLISEPLAYVERQRAQAGLFTELTHKAYYDVEAYLRSLGRLQLLRRFDVNANKSLHILRDLALMNITPSTMFPDAGGAAREANLNIGHRLGFLIE